MPQDRLFNFPKINATLNGCSAVLLVTGPTFIARGKMAGHRAVMLTAAATYFSSGHWGAI